MIKENVSFSHTDAQNSLCHQWEDVSEFTETFARIEIHGDSVLSETHLIQDTTILSMVHFTCFIELPSFMACDRLDHTNQFVVVAGGISSQEGL